MSVARYRRDATFYEDVALHGIRTALRRRLKVLGVEVHVDLTLEQMEQILEVVDEPAES